MRPAIIVVGASSAAAYLTYFTTKAWREARTEIRSRRAWTMYRSVH